MSARCRPNDKYIIGNLFADNSHVFNLTALYRVIAPTNTNTQTQLTHTHTHLAALANCSVGPGKLAKRWTSRSKCKIGVVFGVEVAKDDLDDAATLCIP